MVGALWAYVWKFKNTDSLPSRSSSRSLSDSCWVKKSIHNLKVEEYVLSHKYFFMGYFVLSCGNI